MPRHASGAGWPVAAAFAAVGAVLAAQQQPAFRAGTRTVPVYATVTASDGRLVTNLTRDDFEILDNGKPQNVSIFANEVQPISVVMMLDRSGSMVRNFELVREAAEQFVTRLLASDKARIGSFSNRIQVDPQQFTSAQGELLNILRTQLQDPGPTPLWNAVAVGMTALLHQDGRRVVLVFTDGADAPGNGGNMNVTLKQAMDRARREDVMVYAIGLAGQTMRPARRPSGRRRGRWGGGGLGGGRLPSAEQLDEGLEKIAAETGGGFFKLASTADLGATFSRVADELHRQYALGFEPQKLDNKTHKLEVRVRRPGTSVRARQSYVARPER